MKKYLALIFVLLLNSTTFSQSKYYVIVSAFTNEDIAKQKCEEYKQKGFANAKVLVSPDYKVFRISISEYPTYKKASEAISTLSRQRKIPIDSWTTDNTQLTGHELNSKDFLLRRVEHIMKNMNNTGATISGEDIRDIDDRLNKIETSLSKIVSRLEQIEQEFSTVKNDHNLVMVGEGQNTMRSRDREIEQILMELNELKNGQLPVVKKKVKKVKAPVKSKPKPVVKKKDTVKKVVPPKPVEKKKPQVKEVKKPKIVKKKLSYNSFDFNDPDVKQATSDAYNLVYVGYNSAIGDKFPYLKYKVEDNINTEGKSQKFLEAHKYFKRYAIYDGTTVGYSEEEFKKGANQKKNGRYFGVSRGYLKGYILGRIDKIVKNKQLKEFKQYLDKLDIKIEIPKVLGRLNNSQKKDYNEFYEKGFRDAFVFGYQRGFKQNVD
jgi:hypothetical protein